MTQNKNPHEIKLSQAHLLAVHQRVLTELGLEGKTNEIQVELDREIGVEPIEKRELIYEAFHLSFSKGRYSATVIFDKQCRIEEIRYPKKLD